MAVRIRVYPNNGMGMGGYGGLGMNRYGASTRIAQVQLQNERKTNNLRLQYERALWAERLKGVQLQAQVQYGGYGAAGYGAAYPRVSPYGMNPYGVQSNSAWMGGMGQGMGYNTGFFGGLGLGGLGLGF